MCRCMYNEQNVCMCACVYQLGGAPLCLMKVCGILVATKLTTTMVDKPQQLAHLSELSLCLQFGVYQMELILRHRHGHVEILSGTATPWGEVLSIYSLAERHALSTEVNTFVSVYHTQFQNFPVYTMLNKPNMSR